MAELKKRLIQIGSSSQEELQGSQSKWRDRRKAAIFQKGTLAYTIASEFVLELAQGAFTEATHIKSRERALPT